MIDVRPVRKLIWLCCENRIRHTLQARPIGSTQVVDWAYKIGALDKIVSCQESENGCADPSSDEAFDSLLRTEFDQLSPAEGNSTKVGKNVVAAFEV